MKKIVMPALCETGWKRKVRSKAFCKIEYEDGRLSISGVIGPRANGNCAGSAGQCYDDIAKGHPAQDWDREKLKKFIGIWKTWHLNDLKPYCQHMKELGWDKEASELVTIRFYKLKSEALAEQKKAERAALAHLREGTPFTPDAEQIFYATLPYEIKTYDEELTGERLDYYEPVKQTQWSTPEKKERRGWLRYDECDKGILCKPCPVCGYKYGTKWLKEEVPQDVIDWLFALPDTPIQPAWV